MALTKEQKVKVLNKVSDIAKKDSTVFLNFHGLSMEDITKMRGALRDAGVSYFVAKKTLVKKAFDESKVAGEMPTLDGELALAWTDTDDVTAPAREVYAFQKMFADKVSILGGVFENTFKNKSGMEEIATIPSLNVLRGMFVNVINSPVQGFAMVLKARSEKLEA